VAISLFSQSAVIVHLADGAVAAHFHFFVMLAALSLYEDAVPFLAGIVFVLLEHGIAGSIDPRAVYNDEASVAHPWLWAVIHGGFVSAAAGIQVLTWNANELVRRRLRLAERQSARERDRSERYLRMAGTMMVAIDARGRVEAANEMVGRVLGYDLDEIAGADWFTFAVPDDDRERARADFARLIGREAGPVERGERPMLTRDGERRLVEWHTTVLREDDGLVSGILCSGLDVTEQRAVDAQVAALAAVTRSVARERDARQAVLDAARELTGASFAMLAEPEPDDTLEMTAASGAELPANSRLRPGEEPSGVGVAYLSGEPFFVADAASDPDVSPRYVRATGAASVLFQPAVVAGAVRGVLVIGWSRRLAGLGARELNVAALLADEAAIAIDRAGHLRELERAAATDVLTGIGNRRAWEDALHTEVARAARSGEALSLVLLDLDSFKSVNDRQGHQAGDRTLKACVAAWRTQLRPTDILARLGGDEFGLLLPGCGLEQARSIGERLARLTPHDAGTSLGAASWEEGEDPAAVVRRADADLYARKAERRSQVG
jgi:diguanylate cyclase (GGDEF)-like protein/PAS domain S-box-containing protein